MIDARRQHLDAVEEVVKAFHYEPYDMAEEILKLRDELAQSDQAYGTCDMENAVLYETRDKLYEENAQLRAAIERVQVLHRQDPERKHCRECQYGLPCRTLRALDGEAA
jgi:hypothetical protein